MLSPNPNATSAGNKLPAIFAAIGPRPATDFLSHSRRCCLIAKAWVRVLARSADPGRPPTWIRERWEWGPLDWPVYWCEAIEMEKLDCGGLAAITRLAAAACDLMVLPIQLIESFDAASCESWRHQWRNSVGVPEWTWDDLAFHEVVGFVESGRLAVWDSTDACWAHDKSRHGYGSIAALRIAPTASVDRDSGLLSVRWKDSPLAPEAWVAF